MNSRERLEHDLDRLISILSSFRDIMAVIMFGSYARGDHDEYSDIDILVIFRDRDAMWRDWDELFEKIGELRLLIHLIPKTYEEFLKSEPTFLDEIYKYGIILYSKYPFTTHLSPPNQRPMKLIIYNLSGLKQREKVRLLYKLYGKGGKDRLGLLRELGGEKLGEGCIIIPGDKLDPILDTFRKFNVNYKLLDVINVYT